MKRKSILISLVMGVVLCLWNVTSGAVEPHSVEALEHGAMAAVHGEQGHADVLVKHAQDALTHAQASEKTHAEAHEHMTEAVKHLEEGIKHGKMGHADVAAKHVNEGLSHIRQSMGR